jgi:hypothetical protein
MKLIITENRLHNLILNYIEEAYPVDEINYTEGHDDLGNPDDSSYTFYIGDYDEDFDIFRWYSKDYWEGDNIEVVNQRIEESPILSFSDSNEFNKLNGMFGDKWEPVFKVWFKENFGLDIKTIF